MMFVPQIPLNVFIIYAREDAVYKERLIKHLSPLTKPGNQKIKIWVDNYIKPGETWEVKIGSIISVTDIFLFLVSSSSIDSKFISEREFPAALSRQKSGNSLLIPVIIHPCGWQSIPELSKLNVLPLTPEGRDQPVSLWTNQESALFAVFKGIEKAVDELIAWRKLGQNPTPARLQQFIATGNYRIYLNEAKSQLAKLDADAWRVASAKNTIQSYERYLNDFPAGKESSVAHSRILGIKRNQEKASFEKAKHEGSIPELQKFINDYPKSLFRQDAESLISKIKLNEDPIWIQSLNAYTISAFQLYVRKYPGGKYESLAKSKIYELTKWEAAITTDSIPAYKDFIERFPSSPLKREAEDKIQICLKNEPQVWMNAKVINTVKSYNDYLERYPEGNYTIEARSAKLQLDKSLFQNAQKLKIFFAFQYYLIQFPDGIHAQEAYQIIRDQKRKSVIGIVLIAFAIFLFYVGAWIWSDKSGLNPDNFIFVNGGTFMLGKAGGPQTNDECATKVSTEGFWISKYEINQSDWKSITGNLPGDQLPCDNCPVDQVSPAEVDSFLKRLNLKIKDRGLKYRLPSEIEWELAALGGINDGNIIYSMFSGGNKIDEVGWYKDNSINKPHESGELEPNILGMYDMTGNVAEICSDKYLPYPDCGVDSRNLQGRVVRGGGYNWKMVNCRVINRGSTPLLERQKGIGFRLVLEK